MEPQPHPNDDLYPQHYARCPRSTEPVEPNLGLVLDELRCMDGRLGDMESRLVEKIEGRCGALEKCVLQGEQRSKECFISLEMFCAEAESERVEMDKQFRGLKLEVNRINCFLERETMAHAQDKHGILTINKSARPTSNQFTDGPVGHRVENTPRDREYGSVFTHTHIPTNGTSQTKPNSRNLESLHERQGDHQSGTFGDFARSSHGRLPKLQFPVFVGEDPQLWRSRCENYFEMYDVESTIWVRVASMHMDGVAARWLQSTEHRVRSASWDQFCSLIHDRFSRDQHEALIRQLFHIRQKGTVIEYVEEFSTLVDQLAAYESKANPLYYAMRFVDGLRDDIRSMVMIQHPPTYDSACALALVQEEAVESSHRKEFKRYEPISHRMAHRSALPLPLPPKSDKGVVPSSVDDKRTTEAARARSPDDKVWALKQYRRARGLCDRCAEKWLYGHKCSSTLQLHAI
jgi:hypothetical protein